MTEDTRRALEIMKPLSDELKIQVRADENYLYLNGQAIGISCNSTYATIMEFVGYLIFMWAKDMCEPVSGAMARRIKRYWFTDAQLEQIKKLREKEAEQ